MLDEAGRSKDPPRLIRSGSTGSAEAGMSFASAIHPFAINFAMCSARHRASRYSFCSDFRRVMVWRSKLGSAHGGILVLSRFQTTTAGGGQARESLGMAAPCPRPSGLSLRVAFGKRPTELPSAHAPGSMGRLCQPTRDEGSLCRAQELPRFRPRSPQSCARSSSGRCFPHPSTIPNIHFVRECPVEGPSARRSPQAPDNQ